MKKIRRKYFVIDGQENLTSWCDDAEKAQCFTSEDAALARAATLAEKNPHCPYYVCSAIKLVVAEVKTPTCHEIP